MTDRSPDWDRLRRLFARLGPDGLAGPDLARDLAEERAAILEFDANLDRPEAERLAGVKSDKERGENQAPSDD